MSGKTGKTRSHRHKWTVKTVQVEGAEVSLTWCCGVRSCPLVVVQSHKFRKPRADMKAVKDTGPAEIPVEFYVGGAEPPITAGNFLTFDRVES